MTLPVTDRLPERVSGSRYEVGPRCSAPDCTRLADHGHHLVRRSASPDTHWIQMADGKIFGNVVGLCVDHHDQVTGMPGVGHEAAIRYDDGVFWWCSVNSDGRGHVFYTRLAALEPQPPSPDSLGEQRAEEELETEEACPACGQKVRAARQGRAPGEPARRRKSWVIKVPDDSEDGAQVLDVLVDDLLPLFGIKSKKTGRYYVVVSALVHAQHDRKALVRSMTGEGG
jgi:ssDNA-binding Zn-finger/Zn-ribbon topoisomerase 1